MARFCDKCNNSLVFGTDKNTGIGYCKSHQYLRTDLSKKSITQKAIERQKLNPTKTPQKSPRFQRLIQTPNEQDIMEIRGVPNSNKGWERIEVNPNADVLWDWFIEQRKSMTGFCKNCGRPSCKNDDKRFHYSLHHILDKAHFPSVATHKSNVLELCFWGEGSCHTRADNKILELSQMACWDEIVTKFIDMYPSIAKSERRRIPEILLQYLEAEI